MNPPFCMWVSIGISKIRYINNTILFQLTFLSMWGQTKKNNGGKNIYIYIVIRKN